MCLGSVKNELTHVECALLDTSLFLLATEIEFQLRVFRLAVRVQLCVQQTGLNILGVLILLAAVLV